MKKVTLLFLVIILGLSMVLAGCGGDSGSEGESATGGEASAADDGKEYTIRAAIMLDTAHPHYIAAETVMKPMIEEGTNGKVKVEVYPNGQLGSDRRPWKPVRWGRWK